jgi:tape measure domain-containing protein
MSEDKASFFVQLHDGVTASARRMRSAIKGLRGEMGQLKRDSSGRFLKTGSTGLAGMGKSISDMHKRWEKFQKSPAFGAIQGGLGRIKEGLLIGSAIALGTAAAIGTLSVKFANFAQTSVLGYQAVAKSANAAGMSAEQLFAMARAEAEKFGLDVMETSNAFKSFMVQGADPKMATNLIGMGADLAALGASGEQVQSTFGAIKKIMSQGKIQGDEMMILAEAGLNTAEAYKQMGQAAGKSVDEIRAMQQAGTLTSDIALPGIIAAVTAMSGGKQAGDAGKKLAESTLGGMAGVLKAQFQNVFIDVAQSSTPAIMSTFRDVSGALSSAFKSEGFQSGLLTAIESIAGVVRDAVPFVQEFVGSLIDGFQEAWPAMQGALDILFDGFGGKQDWMENVKQFGRTLGKVTAGVVGLATVVGGALIAGLELASKWIEGVMFAWEALIEGIGAGVFAVSDFFANLSAKWDAFDFGAMAGEVIDGLINGIVGGISGVWDAVTGLGNAVIDALKSTLGIASPSKEADYVGDMIGAGIEGGFITRMKAANDNMGRAAGDIIPAIDGPVSASIAQAPDVGAGFGGGGGHYESTFNIAINVSQLPGEDSQDLAQRIALECRRQVDARLEELAIEAA